MQSSKQVDDIVQTKIQSANNKKVIDDMQLALKEMFKEEKTDLRYAAIGLTLSALVIIYLIIIFLY